MTETAKRTELEAGVSGAAPLLGLPEERWERSYYNSYGNYEGYRFQDFRARCKFRSGPMVMGDCAHPENRLGKGAECLCDFCPMVQKDYDDQDPDEPDYSEGEQPILVLKPNAQGQPTCSRSEAKAERSAAPPCSAAGD